MIITSQGSGSINQQIYLYEHSVHNERYGLYTKNRGKDFIIPTVFAEYTVDYNIADTTITIPSQTLYTVVNAHSNNADFGGSQFVVARIANDKIRVIKSKGTKLVIYCVKDNG